MTKKNDQDDNKKARLEKETDEVQKRITDSFRKRKMTVIQILEEIRQGLEATANSRLLEGNTESYSSFMSAAAGFSKILIPYIGSEKGLKIK